MRKWLAEFALTWGLDVEFVDTGDHDAVSSAIRPGRTRLLWVETPANPMWEITDLAGICNWPIPPGSGGRRQHGGDPGAHRPPRAGRRPGGPFRTKYLNGHSDVLAGAVLTARRDPFWERIRSWRRNAGAVPGPFERGCCERGMRTLFLRVHRSSDSAMAVARHAGHPALAAVLYPGLPSHPGHQIRGRQMRGGFGGMLSIRLAGGAEQAMAVLGAVRVFKRATSLGGVELIKSTGAAEEGPPPRCPRTCCACRSASKPRGSADRSGRARRSPSDHAPLHHSTSG